MKNTISCSIFFSALALLVLPLRCIADTAICHVVDPAGKPIANATVYSTSNPMQDGDVSALTADKSGNFKVDNIGNDYRVYIIDARGFAPTGGTLAAGENTFQLGLPTKLTGEVVDSQGRPVVGAVVTAQSAVIFDSRPNVPGFGRTAYFLIAPLVNRYTAKTDSTGTYTLDGLPAGSKIEVELNDPRFVINSVMSEKGAAAAPPLTAVAGTSISGKVIREDGKAIGSVIRVTAAMDGMYNGISPIAKVASDGTYKLTGITAGSYMVGLLTSQDNTGIADWAVPTPVNVTATIETPGAAPDLVLTAGGIITGSVLDADTKKPIPDVDVTIQNNSYANIMQSVHSETDADGKFTVRVWAGKVVEYTINEPNDYVPDPNSQQRKVTSVAGQTVTMDPILLKHSVVVTGVAVDDSGKPVSNITLTTQKVQQDGVWLYIPPTTTSSDTGAFSIHRLVPGSFWIDPGLDWSVVSPKSFTVPTVSPIKLVLKKNATVAIQGTVVDTSNVPVAGVDIAFVLDHDTAPGYRMGNQVDVTSGPDGKFTLPDAPVDSTMVQRSTVTKNGYVFKSGGDISASSGQVIVSPIVVAQLGGKVNGIVYNGLGKPAAKAWVFCPDSGSDAVPVQTDDAGRFELSNLVVGSVTIDAAKGLFFSRSSVQASISSAKSIVRLPSVPSASVGTASLTKAIVMLTKNINDQAAKKNRMDDGGMRDEAAHIIAEVSPDAAVSFILSTSSISTWDLDRIVSARTDSDPIGIANWAQVPIKRMSDNNGRGMAAVRIGLAVASYDAVAAQPYYDLAAQYIPLDHLDQGSIMNAMRLTALAYALHRPEADNDYAKVSAALDGLIKNSKNDSNPYSSADWLPQNLATTLALGNVDKAIAMLEAQPINNRYNYVSLIVSELVKPNPRGALAVYHWIAQDTASNNMQWAEERALCLVLPIIYKTDPKGAVVQAHSIGDASTEAQALSELADLMPLAAAGPLYREAEQKSVYQFGMGYTPACVAYHAWQRDQVLGAKLFNLAYMKFTAASAKAHQPGMGPSYSDFAFYYSHIDPALSRILVEEQFAKDNLGSNPNYGGDSAQADVAAMCAIDINRAIEMAGTIQDQSCYYAGLKPAQFVLLTPQQRNEIPFSQWGNNSDWTPGMPSN
jgi:hypothetical protein